MTKIRIFMPGSHAWFFDFINNTLREVEVMEVSVKGPAAKDDKPQVAIKVKCLDNPSIEWTFTDGQLFDTREKCIDNWIKTLGALKK